MHSKSFKIKNLQGVKTQYIQNLNKCIRKCGPETQEDPSGATRLFTKGCVLTDTFDPDRSTLVAFSG